MPERVEPSGTYSHKHHLILNILVLVSCLLTITTVPFVIVWWVRQGGIQARFRHFFIIGLLTFDLLKAITLCIIPFLHIGDKATLGFRPQSCGVLGFFTSYAIEGADFSVLFLAIHTAVVIFAHPSRHTATFRTLTSTCIFILIPVLLAALGFIAHPGYVQLEASCGISFSSYWYRLAFSWIPRWTIMFSIGSIYVMIYFYVKSQMNTLELTMSPVVTDLESAVSSPRSKPMSVIVSGVQKTKCWASQFPGFAWIYPLELPLRSVGNSAQGTGTLRQSTTLADEDSPSPHGALTDSLQIFVQSVNSHRFRQQRSMIERQLSLMFVYPVVYVIIWSFPLVDECVHLSQSDHNRGRFWISVVSNFMVPLSGFIDSLLFYSKEKYLQTQAHTNPPVFELNELHRPVRVSVDEGNANMASHSDESIQPVAWNPRLEFRGWSQSSPQISDRMGLASRRHSTAHRSAIGPSSYDDAEQEQDMTMTEFLESAAPARSSQFFA